MSKQEETFEENSSIENDIFQIVDRVEEHVLGTPPNMLRSIEPEGPDVRSRKLEICYNKLMFEVVITDATMSVIPMKTSVFTRIRMQFRPNCRFLDVYSSYDCEFTFTDQGPKLIRILRSDRKQDSIQRTKSILIDHSIVNVHPEIIVRTLVPKFIEDLMKEFIHHWAQSLRHDYTSDTVKDPDLN